MTTYWLLILVLLCSLNSISSSSSSSSSSSRSSSSSSRSSIANSNSVSRHLEETTTTVVTDIIDTKINTKNENNIDKVNDPTPILRTATGGFVHTIMVFLTIVSFIGNGAFMVYVFWLSK